MNDTFEKDVFYFVELVFYNIQKAKNTKNKKKMVFSNIQVRLNGEEIQVHNIKKNYSYVLKAKEIQQYSFNQYLVQYLALLYIDKLTKYLNNKLSFNELADIRQTPKIVKNILEQKNNISDQLRLLRKSQNNIEVQKYITELYNYKFTSDYLKYLIDRYYYNKKNLIKPNKNGLEKMFKLLLH